MEKEVIRLKPTIKEKRIYNLHYIILAVIIQIFIIIGFIILLYIFNLTRLESVLLGALFIIFYAIMLFFLLEPKLLREVTQPILETQEKEVVIEKPIYQQIPYETEKTIYITSPKQSIKKYKYYGSIKSKVYHKATCRQAKLITGKYKIGKDDPSFFKKHKFSACKICIQGKYPSLK